MAINLLKFEFDFYLILFFQEAATLSTTLDSGLATALSTWQNISSVAEGIRFNATQALNAVRLADTATQAYMVGRLLNKMADILQTFSYEMCFIEQKCLNFDCYFTKVCF